MNNPHLNPLQATDDGEGVYVMIKNPSTGEKLE